MKRNVRFVPFALLLAVGLSACGSDDAAGTAQEPDTDTVVVTEADAVGADVLAKFSSCADVTPAVARYVEGLEEYDTNAVDEYGVHCAWQTPADATDLSQIREVEVLIEPGRGEVTATTDLEAANLEIVPDAAVEKAGGVAYTMSLTTAVAGVTVTTVEFPDVLVTVTGGEWEGLPSLDGPAAVAAARQLLGM